MNPSSHFSIGFRNVISPRHLACLFRYLVSLKHPRHIGFVIEVLAILYAATVDHFQSLAVQSQKTHRRAQRDGLEPRRTRRPLAQQVLIGCPAGLSITRQLERPLIERAVIGLLPQGTPFVWNTHHDPSYNATDLHFVAGGHTATYAPEPAWLGGHRTQRASLENALGQVLALISQSRAEGGQPPLSLADPAESLRAIAQRRAAQHARETERIKKLKIKTPEEFERILHYPVYRDKDGLWRYTPWSRPPQEKDPLLGPLLDLPPAHSNSSSSNGLTVELSRSSTSTTSPTPKPAALASPSQPPSLLDMALNWLIPKKKKPASAQPSTPEAGIDIT